MDSRAFIAKVREREVDARQYFDTYGYWEHQASLFHGKHFEDFVANGKFFENPAGPLLSPTIDKVREGRWLLGRHCVHLKKEDEKKNMVAFQFTYARSLEYIQWDKLPACLDEMYAEMINGKCILTVQCRREHKIPLYFDIDEKVEDPSLFFKTDLYVESIIAALINFIYPQGVKWWWLRPSHVRKKTNPDGKIIYIGGVHIHVEAVVQVNIMSTFMKWVFTYIESFIDDYPHVCIDRGVYSANGCYRPALCWKSEACPNRDKHCRCISECPLCFGLAEVLTAPPYVFKEEYRTFEKFLWTTMFVDSSTERTPCASEVEGTITEDLAHPRSNYSSQKIMGLYGPLVRGGFEGGKILKLHPDVVEYIFTREFMRLWAKHGTTAGDKKNYGVPYLYDGAIVIPMTTHHCLLASAAEGKEVVHGMNRNFYFVAPDTGAFFLRCRSKKRACCNPPADAKKLPPVFVPDDMEYARLFNHRRSVLVEPRPEPVKEVEKVMTHKDYIELFNLPKTLFEQEKADWIKWGDAKTKAELERSLKMIPVFKKTNRFVGIKSYLSRGMRMCDHFGWVERKQELQLWLDQETKEENEKKEKKEEEERAAKKPRLEELKQ